MTSNQTIDPLAQRTEDTASLDTISVDGGGAGGIPAGDQSKTIHQTGPLITSPVRELTLADTATMTAHGTSTIQQAFAQDGDAGYQYTHITPPGPLASHPTIIEIHDNSLQATLDIENYCAESMRPIVVFMNRVTRSRVMYDNDGCTICKAAVSKARKDSALDLVLTNVLDAGKSRSKWEKDYKAPEGGERTPSRGRPKSKLTGLPPPRPKSLTPPARSTEVTGGPQNALLCQVEHNEMFCISLTTDKSTRLAKLHRCSMDPTEQIFSREEIQGIYSNVNIDNPYLIALRTKYSAVIVDYSNVIRCLRVTVNQLTKMIQLLRFCGFLVIVVTDDTGVFFEAAMNVYVGKKIHDDLFMLQTQALYSGLIWTKDSHAEFGMGYIVCTLHSFISLRDNDSCPKCQDRTNLRLIPRPSSAHVAWQQIVIDHTTERVVSFDLTGSRQKRDKIVVGPYHVASPVSISDFASGTDSPVPFAAYAIMSAYNMTALVISRGQTIYTSDCDASALSALISRLIVQRPELVSEMKESNTLLSVKPCLRGVTVRRPSRNQLISQIVGSIVDGMDIWSDRETVSEQATNKLTKIKKIVGQVVSEEIQLEGKSQHSVSTIRDYVKREVEGVLRGEKLPEKLRPTDIWEEESEVNRLQPVCVMGEVQVKVTTGITETMTSRRRNIARFLSNVTCHPDIRWSSYRVLLLRSLIDHNLCIVWVDKYLILANITDAAIRSIAQHVYNSCVASADRQNLLRYLPFSPAISRQLTAVPDLQTEGTAPPAPEAESSRLDKRNRELQKSSIFNAGNSEQELVRRCMFGEDRKMVGVIAAAFPPIKGGYSLHNFDFKKWFPTFIEDGNYANWDHLRTFMDMGTPDMPYVHYDTEHLESIATNIVLEKATDLVSALGKTIAMLMLAQVKEIADVVHAIITSGTMSYFPRVLRGLVAERVKPDGLAPIRIRVTAVHAIGQVTMMLTITDKQVFATALVSLSVCVSEIIISNLSGQSAALIRSNFPEDSNWTTWALEVIFSRMEEDPDIGEHLAELTWFLSMFGPITHLLNIDPVVVIKDLITVSSLYRANVHHQFVVRWINTATQVGSISDNISRLTKGAAFVRTPVSESDEIHTSVYLIAKKLREYKSAGEARLASLESSVIRFLWMGIMAHYGYPQVHAHLVACFQLAVSDEPGFPTIMSLELVAALRSMKAFDYRCRLTGLRVTPATPLGVVSSRVAQHRLQLSLESRRNVMIDILSNSLVGVVEGSNTWWRGCLVQTYTVNQEVDIYILEMERGYVGRMEASIRTLVDFGAKEKQIHRKTFPDFPRLLKHLELLLVKTEDMLIITSDEIGPLIKRTGQSLTIVTNRETRRIHIPDTLLYNSIRHAAAYVGTVEQVAATKTPQEQQELGIIVEPREEEDRETIMDTPPPLPPRDRSEAGHPVSPSPPVFVRDGYFSTHTIRTALVLSYLRVPTRVADRIDPALTSLTTIKDDLQCTMDSTRVGDHMAYKRLFTSAEHFIRMGTLGLCVVIIVVGLSWARRIFQKLQTYLWKHTLYGDYMALMVRPVWSRLMALIALMPLTVWAMSLLLDECACLAISDRVFLRTDD